MPRFKPQIVIITNDSLRKANNSYGKISPYVTKQYKTYRDLKRNIKIHLRDNLEANVSVSRSRRGEWGEWFEVWTLQGGVPVIINQGWQ